MKQLFWTIAGTVIVGIAMLGVPGELHRANRPLPQSAYVWQRVWSDDVVESVAHFSDHLDQYMVLAAESRLHDELVTWVVPPMNWDALAEAEVPTTLVFRMGSEVTPHLQDERAHALMSDVYEIWDALSAQARQAGVNVDGVQLDYDSPTGKLSAYQKMLAALRKKLPDTPISITTLPTWMSDEGFASLVQTADYFVLQVHSLERPGHINDPVELVNTEAIPAYLETAAETGIPYTVALPTYGYELIFDRAGDFMGIVAEQQIPELREGDRVRTIQSDPAVMTALTNYLRSNPPKGCIGITWFRLPVDADTLNWPRDTMMSVLSGGTPEANPSVTAVEIRANLYEIQLDGRFEGSPANAIIIIGRTDDVLFADVIGDSTLERHTNEFRFNSRPPRSGTAIPIGWVRVTPGSPAPHPRLEIPETGVPDRGAAE